MQKKTRKLMMLLAIIMLMTVCLALNFMVNANENYEVDGYRYSVQDGYACIYEAALNSDGEFFIPAELGGYPVTSVGFSTNIRCKAFDVDSENQFLSNDEFGVLFNKDKTVLLRFPSDLHVLEYHIPSSVDELGKMAFCIGGKIEKLYIHKDIIKICDEPNYHTFSLGNNICEFMVDSENPNFASIDGVLYSKDYTRLISIPGGKDYEEFVIPSFVEEISYHGSTCLKIGVLRFEEGTKIKSFHGGAFSFSQIDKLIIPKTLKLENIGFGDAVFKEVVFEIGREEEILDKILHPFVALSIELPTSIISIKEGTLKNFKNITILNPFCELASNFCSTGCIIGYEKSTTHDYAILHNISFQPLECDHKYGFDKWVSNFDNMTATRECVTCYYVETKPLETTGNGGVDIIAPLNPDTNFEVGEIEKHSESYVIIDEALKGSVNEEYEIVKAFDINLKSKDGVHVQPDGTVKVKLPLDWTKDGVYKVYRVNDDGSLTDMNAYRQGSHMVFETDHFSIYVIVDISEKTEPEEPETPDAPTEPDTSDCNCICHKEGFIYEILAIVFKFVSKLLGVFPTCDCGIAHY